MYKKYSNLIVYIIFIVFFSSTVCAMDTHKIERHKYEHLKSGDFTPFLDDMVQRIVAYLYTSLPDDCTAESFNEPSFRIRLRRSQDNNKKGLGRLDMTCKRFILLENPSAVIHKIILSDLLFELLRHSKHNRNTASHICLCIGAGADINYCNEWNLTPLVYAISTPSCHKFINMLIKKGAQVNQVGALEMARYCDYHDIADLLISYGAQLNSVDDYDSDDDLSSDSSESYSVSESFYAYSTESSEDSSYSESDNRPQYIVVNPELSNDLGQEDDSSSSSESDKIEAPKNINDGISTIIRQNFVPIVVGVIVVAGVCYWVYKQYKACAPFDEQPELYELAENSGMKVGNL